jgi:hypothetical protein
MDCKVIGSQIAPLKYRIRPEQPLPRGLDIAWPTDDSAAILAYSDAERDGIVGILTSAAIEFTVKVEPQPDPALLAACQGKVHSRSEALAALAAGKPPVTLETIAADVEQLKLAKAEPLPKEF